MATDVAALAIKFQTTGANQVMQTLKGLQNGSIKAQKATEGLAGATVKTGKQFKINNQLVQQAGFQVGDFATQVASGQSALVAFTQQFSQLAGFLGPAGPVIGAVVAIGGAIAVGLSNAFSEAEGEAKKLEFTLDDLISKIDELTVKQATFAISQLEKQRDALTDVGGGALITSARIETLKMNLSKFPGNSKAQEWREELARLESNSDSYSQKVAELNSQIDQLNSRIDDATKGIDTSADATKEARTEIDRLNEALQFQVDNYGESEKAIELARIAQLEKNGADEAAIANARALTNELYKKIDATKAEEEARRSSARRARQRSQLVSQLDPLQAEKDRYAEQLRLLDQFNFDKEQRRALELEAERQHSMRLVQISQGANKQQIQGMQLFTDTQSQQLGAVGQIFGNMAELAKQGGKEQFDAWKIFASAQAAVNTALAISNALTVQPAPLGIALAGTIGALGIAQQAAIQATEYQGSYLGGGYTGSGSRTGGIDGKGGFPAILHPNETVIDHTKGQSMGGEVTVVINNAPQGTTVKETQDADGNTFVNVFLADMARGGPMSRSVQSTFGVSRQGR